MSFFGSFTGSSQRKDMKRAYADSDAMVTEGYGKASGELASGRTNALADLTRARGDIDAGYRDATGQVRGAADRAVAYYDPYVQAGTGATNLYSNALGINGRAAQETFMGDYAGSDPFRNSNEDFANEALMRTLNARGLSGSGYAAQAVARGSLERGSQDYNTYLDRLSGVSSQGLSAASGAAGIRANQGNALAQLASDRGSQLAGISGQRANMNYGYGQDQAGLSTDLATTRAGNRINLGNSLANSRGIGWNNLINIAGTAAKAYAGMR